MDKQKAAVTISRHPGASAAPRALAQAAVTEVLEEHESAPDGLARMDPQLRHEMISTAAY
ncbi:MAG: hypothetical protein JSR15_11190, partial [Proteobacteria bacterium]|nr:hypothetical protein [Pseudomonadota bacterium]